MTLFPYKLHELLTDMQANPHLSAIISWISSGNAFKIHQPELFQDILLNKYFPRQTQINSFKRQLLYYGFDNLGDGIFAHPCFLRDQRHLCGQITHTNPTKSQREGNASIPSRRVRGKRAKQALRQSLAKADKINKASKKTNKSTSLPGSMKPISMPLVGGASPLAPTAQVAAPPSPLMTAPTMIDDITAVSSLQKMLLQAQDKPNQYFNLPFMPPTLSTLALAQSNGLPLAQVANMLPMNFNNAGLPSMGLPMPQSCGSTSPSSIMPPIA